MIRSSIHTPRTFTAIPAGVILRPGTAWNAFACMGLDQQNYLAELGGDRRAEQT